MALPNDGSDARPIQLRDIPGFVPMLLAACADSAMKAQLVAIVDLPADKREVGLRRLLDHLRERRAPRQLTDTMTCLLDDEIAHKVKDALRRCP